MTKQALWRGNTSIKEAPDSPEWVFGVTKDTCSRTFIGRYATCLTYAQSLQPGRTMSDLDVAGFVIVDGIKVKKEKGGKAIVTVPLERYKRIPPRELDPDQKITEPVYEVDWIQVEKKLTQHPIFQTGGTYALTAQDLCDLAAWEKEDDYRLKAQFKYVNGDKSTGSQTPITLSANAQKAAEKMLKGTEAFNEYAPVVKETVETSLCPKGDVCGNEVNLTFLGGALKEYTFIQTADRGTKTGSRGRWQRTFEYTGALTVDEDLYPKKPRRAR